MMRLNETGGVVLDTSGMKISISEDGRGYTINA